MALLHQLQDEPFYTPQVHHSAREFKTETEFLNNIQESIERATHHQELVYTEVDPQWASNILDLLDEAYEERTVRLMPTDLHNTCDRWYRNQELAWMQTQLLTYDEARYLQPLHGTTIKFRFPPYAGSRKEPDFGIRTANDDLPTVVMEAGWSESLSRLKDDMDLWLVGGNGKVNVVILLNWRKVHDSNAIRGSLEVYTLDRNGIPVLHQTEVIFPAPTNTALQAIPLTRQVLFGQNIPPGRNPNDILPLSLDKLRTVATEELGRMGLVPA